MDILAAALAVAGLAVAALAVFYSISVYNGLVLARQNVAKAWGNIDVLLVQRHDELPALVEVCKGFAQHEASTLEHVTKLRARYAEAAGSVERTGIENELNLLLAGFLTRAEAYPDLKASDSFLKCQQRITGLEDAIAARREFFNESVLVYNTHCVQFPAVLVARRAGFAPHAFLEAPGAARDAVRTDFKG